MTLSGRLRTTIKAALLILAIFIVLDIESRSLSTCIAGENPETQHGHNGSNQDRCSSLYSALSRSVAPILVPLDGFVVRNINEISATLSAVATVVIAWFTIALSRATIQMQVIADHQHKEMMRGTKAAKKAAKASDLSARAAIALELPLLRVSPSTPIPLKEDAVILFAPEARIVGAPISQITKFAIIDGLLVYNAGRTAATPLRIKWGTIVADHLEGEPFYALDRPAEPQSLLPVGTLTTPNSVISQIDYIVTLTDDEVERLQRPGEFFWAYAEISYLDFMDEQRDVRFCWRWERDGTRGWRWIGRSDVPLAYLKKTDH